MMACEVVEFYFHSFLTWTVDGGEWSASPTVYFVREERTPVTGHWEGLRAGLDALQKGKISSPWQDSKYGASVIQPVA